MPRIFQETSTTKSGFEMKHKIITEYLTEQNRTYSYYHYQTIKIYKYISKNFAFSINEFKSSLFMKDFIAKAQKMIPDVNASMLERGPAGVRAQAISPEGILQMDFNIIRKGRQIHVLNAPSPGATASLAIASHIIENFLVEN